MGRAKDRSLIGKERGPGRKSKKQADPVHLIDTSGKYNISISSLPLAIVYNLGALVLEIIVSDGEFFQAMYISFL